MANREEGEGSCSNPNEEQGVEDQLSQLKKLVELHNERYREELISKMKKYEEKFKKYSKEVLSAKRKKDQLTREVAEWAKDNTKPLLREVLIRAFQKIQETSSKSSFSFIEMLIKSLKEYVKEMKDAEMENQGEEREYTLNELLDRLSEVAQQVIDLKSPKPKWFY